MSLPNLSAQSPPGPSTLPIPPLPVPQLESLKFKANQIIESIQALQWTIEAGGNPQAMPAWPDVLSKYNMLLSQTHNFSSALVNPLPSHGQASRTGQGPGNSTANVYERIALHPGMAMLDSQLDGEVIPLLRNQQTTDVLRVENETVRRLAEHMTTRGSLGVLGAPSQPKLQPHPIHLNGFGAGLQQKKPEYEDVLRECTEISGAHDRRVDRAVRAVTMLREKFDWKQRVEVEVEEPEELEWDPRLGRAQAEAPADEVREGDDGDVGMESGDDDNDEGKGGSSDEDEVNVEGALVDSGEMEGQTPLSNGLFSETSPTTEGNTEGPTHGTATTATVTGDAPMEGIQ